MWICFNDGFISAVRHFDDPEVLVVRARRPEILSRLFPHAKIKVGGSTDYNYRVFVSKAAFSKVVAENIDAIDYGNFKGSVKDSELKALYGSFWELHYAYQR